MKLTCNPAREKNDTIQQANAGTLSPQVCPPLRLLFGGCRRARRRPLLEEVMQVLVELQVVARCCCYKVPMTMMRAYHGLLGGK